MCATAELTLICVVAVTNDILETSSYIEAPETYVEECDVPTQTIYQYRGGPTTTIWRTIERFRTNGALTSYYQTTQVLGAYCHWPAAPTVDRPPPYTPPPPQCEGCRPWWTSGGWTWTWPTTTTETHTRTVRTTTTRTLPPVITSVTVIAPPPPPPGSSSYTVCRGRDPCTSTSTRPRGPSSSPPVITSITFLPPTFSPTTRCRGDDCKNPHRH